MDLLSGYRDFSWKFASECLRREKGSSCVSSSGAYILLSALAQGTTGKSRKELDKLLSPNFLEVAEQLCQYRKKLSSVESQFSIQIPNNNNIKSTYRKDLLFDMIDLNRTFSRNAIVSSGTDIFKLQWVDKFQKEMHFFWEPYNGHIKLMPLIFVTAPPHQRPYINHYPFICEEGALNFQDTAEFLNVSVPINENYHIVLAMPKNRKLSDCIHDRYMERALTLLPYPKNLCRDSDPTQNVTLMMPILQAESHICDMKLLLKKLGTTGMFSGFRKDVTEITNRGLYVKEMAHKAKIELIVKNGSPKEYVDPVKKFIGRTPDIVCSSKLICFNHPFMFAVWTSSPRPIPVLIGTFYGPWGEMLKRR